ncbi:MAG TPA: pyridoxamine 5'-phosphate oxidase family protein [Nocardioidaceae bacterium]|nr:pyridoxamine 5'-phosphate oxidase family protein [Nocardioidaceae bacterium]
MHVLSPTDRTQLHRHRDRASADRRDLLAILAESLICHLGVVMDGFPLVVPTVFGVDPDGPDRGGSLYLHGSVASGSLRAAPGAELCVTCTLVDGLVLARSGFHHSMNYRSAVVIGPGRLVDDTDEKQRALDLVVDHVVPGRSATLRAHTRKELVATTVVAMPLYEASVKQRVGGVVDDQDDIDAGVWAGVVPLATTAGAIEVDVDADGMPTPADVLGRVARLVGVPRQP